MSFDLIYIFIIGFFSLSLICFWAKLRLYRKRMTWDYTNDAVVSSEMRQNVSFSHNICPTVIYKVEGKTYTFTSSIAQSPPLRPGKKVRVYYNPDNPNEAMIHTYIQRGGMYTTLSIVLFLLGLFFSQSVM